MPAMVAQMRKHNQALSEALRLYISGIHFSNLGFFSALVLFFCKL